MSLEDRLRALVAPLAPNQYAMLQPAFFAEKLGVANDDVLGEALLAATRGADAHLERWGVIFDADGEEHAIDTEDFREFEESGVLVHPMSGEVIPAERMSIFFAVRAPGVDAPSP